MNSTDEAVREAIAEGRDFTMPETLSAASARFAHYLTKAFWTFIGSIPWLSRKPGW